MSGRDFTDRWAQELRLQGATGNATWIVGLFYEHIENGFDFFSRIENYEDTPAFDFWNTQYGVQPGTTDDSDYSVRVSQVTGQVAVFGEVGLSGEIRGIPQAALRVREATQMGFGRVVLPAGNVDPAAALLGEGRCELVGVRTVGEALDELIA